MRGEEIWLGKRYNLSGVNPRYFENWRVERKRRVREGERVRKSNCFVEEK